MKSDQMTCSVLLALFNRRGGSGRGVRPIEDWSKDAFSRFFLDEGELPVILGHPGGRNEFLITTRSLYVCNKKIEFYEMVGINPYMLGAKGVSLQADLEVVLRSGDVVVLRVEPGKPFFGVWSVLMYAAQSLGGSVKVRRKMSEF